MFLCSHKKKVIYMHGDLDICLGSNPGVAFLQENLYNTNEFGIETMYDYYIAMKSMFLVVKLFSQPSIVYASLTILLP